MTTLTAGVDPRVLRPEDLVRYAQPSTPLEEALLAALKEYETEVERWSDVGYNVNKLTPKELADFIEELQDNQKPDGAVDLIESVREFRDTLDNFLQGAA